MSSPSAQKKACAFGIVTAAGGAIGSAVVRNLLGKGMGVLGCDISVERLNSLQAELSDRASSFVPFEADVLDPPQVSRMTEAAMSHFGSVDFLVNVVGGAKNSSLLDMPVEEWDYVIDINLKSAFLCTKSVAGHMMAQQFGRIVTISSFAKDGVRWFAPIGFSRVHYSAANAGLVGFTRALSIELGSYGITANCVVAGPIQLPRSQKIWDRIESDDSVHVKPRDLISLGKYCKPEYVAGSVDYLLSEAAEFVTGTEQYVTGGL